MQEVKVQRDELLVKVRQNREDHRKELDEAMVEMFKDIAAHHQEQLDIFEAGDILELDTNYNFPVPEDHDDEYDQVITMLEMSVDAELVLSYNEFQQYVMDKWHWKNEHVRTMAFYSKS